MHLIFEQYSERLRRRKKAPRTLTNFARAAGGFDTWARAAGVDAARATFAEVEDYFDQLDLAASSKRTHLANLRAAYRYAQRRGLIAYDPTIDVFIEREPDEEPTILSGFELRDIRDRCLDQRDWTLFHLLAYAGLRRNEARTLLEGNVDLPANTLRLVGKGGKLRLIPIHPALGEALRLTGDPAAAVLRGRFHLMSEDTLHKVGKRLAPGHTFHAFRRTVASNLRRNGVEEFVVDRIMGWAPRGVQRRYYLNVADEQLQRAILKLYADDPV